MTGDCSTVLQPNHKQDKKVRIEHYRLGHARLSCLGW